MGEFQLKAEGFIAHVSEGLDSCPHADSQMLYNSKEHGGGEQAILAHQQLLDASEHLKDKVVMPLEDLAYRTVSSLDSLKELYLDQSSQLGEDGGALIDTSDSSGSGAKGDTNCIRAQLRTYEDSRRKLETRLAKIGGRLVSQRAKAAELLRTYGEMASTRAPEQGSAGVEVEGSLDAYREKLEEWKQKSQQVSHKLGKFAALVKVATGEVVLDARTGGVLGESNSVKAREQRLGTSYLSSPYRNNNPSHGSRVATTPFSLRKERKDEDEGEGEEKAVPALSTPAKEGVSGGADTNNITPSPKLQRGYLFKSPYTGPFSSASKGAGGRDGAAAGLSTVQKRRGSRYAAKMAQNGAKDPAPYQEEGGDSEGVNEPRTPAFTSATPTHSTIKFATTPTSQAMKKEGYSSSREQSRVRESKVTLPKLEEADVVACYKMLSEQTQVIESANRKMEALRQYLEKLKHTEREGK